MLVLGEINWSTCTHVQSRAATRGTHARGELHVSAASLVANLKVTVGACAPTADVSPVTGCAFGSWNEARAYLEFRKGPTELVFDALAWPEWECRMPIGSKSLNASLSLQRSPIESFSGKLRIATIQCFHLSSVIRTTENFCCNTKMCLI